MAQDLLKLLDEQLENGVDVNTLNDAIKAEAASKQGVDTTVQPRNEKGQFVSPVSEVSTPTESEAAEEVVYRDEMVIGGKKIQFEASTPQDLLQQVKVALQASAQPEAKPAEAKEAKPALSQAEMFELGLKLQKGEVEAIDEYLDKSGAVDRYFEKRGLNLNDLKEIVNETRSTKEVRTVEQITQQFMKNTLDTDHPWPGGENNMKLMGYKMAELGLADKPSVENFQKAYDALLTDGMIYEQPKQETAQPQAQAQPQPVKRKATSSSAFGAGAESGTRKKALNQVEVSKEEIDKAIRDMDPIQLMQWWNENLEKQGYIRQN